MATAEKEWHKVDLPPGEPSMKREWGDVLGRHLAECVEGKTKPAFGGEHAVHVVEIMEKILASAQSGEVLPGHQLLLIWEEEGGGPAGPPPPLSA